MVYDSLTGLPNRALFRDRLGQAMARARRSGTPMALMFLDLDNFKVINDSLGHEVGDQLLRMCRADAGRPACARSDSVSRRGGADDAFTVSRLGGDEFTVIAERWPSAEDAAQMARRILDALEAPDAPDGDRDLLRLGQHRHLDVPHRRCRPRRADPPHRHGDVPQQGTWAAAPTASTATSSAPRWRRA
jgi:diguanylate cyclase (GGDEF)-like protein